MSYDERYAAELVRLRAQAHVALMPAISRLSDALALTTDVYRLFTTVGLTELDERIAAFRNDMDSVPLQDGISDEEDKRIRVHLRTQTEETARMRHKLLGARILNQGLVSLCTAFDIFLGDCTDLVLRLRPHLLYGEGRSLRRVPLREVVELGSVAVLARCRDSYNRHLAYEGIVKRISWFGRHGVDVDALFRFESSAATMQDRLKGWTLARLGQSYDDRHSVVHGDALPLASMAAFAELADVFIHLSFGLGRDLSKTLDLPTDIAIPIIAQRIAKGEATSPS